MVSGFMRVNIGTRMGLWSRHIQEDHVVFYCCSRNNYEISCIVVEVLGRVLGRVWNIIDSSVPFPAMFWISLALDFSWLSR